MKVIDNEIMNYRCPRWEELPQLDLYIDQVVIYLQDKLSVFFSNEESPIITSTMINNYVKQKIIEPPVKKKYSRNHLAHLFVICILKQQMSISQIGKSMEKMKKNYEVCDAYNLFCDELEKALKSTFSPQQYKMTTIEEAPSREIAVLYSMVYTFSYMMLTQKLIFKR